MLIQTNIITILLNVCHELFHCPLQLVILFRFLNHWDISIPSYTYPFSLPPSASHRIIIKYKTHIFLY
ncbi:hypothetical protein RJT34_21967 [Clitoria ternatea]|uniref:Uncharacterized protein n=1 Tax=Clitoria ternatea TaxID=43366 RepID=A0AAN9IUV1_CLITE